MSVAPADNSEIDWWSIAVSTFAWVRLVPAGLDGNCRPAVRCALRQFSEGLCIQILHRGIRDLRPGPSRHDVAGELGAGISHRCVLLDARRLQGIAEPTRHGREIATPGTRLPAGDTTLHAGRHAERAPLLGELGGRDDLALRRARAAPRGRTTPVDPAAPGAVPPEAEEPLEAACLSSAGRVGNQGS